MNALVWIVRIIVFVFLFLLALNNTSVVTLRFFMGYVWQAPLILIVLVFFLAGILLGMLALLPRYARARKQVSTLSTQPPPPSNSNKSLAPDSRFRIWNR